MCHDQDKYCSSGMCSSGHFCVALCNITVILYDLEDLNLVCYLIANVIARHLFEFMDINRDKLFIRSANEKRSLWTVAVETSPLSTFVLARQLLCYKNISRTTFNILINSSIYKLTCFSFLKSHKVS